MRPGLRPIKKNLRVSPPSLPSTDCHPPPLVIKEEDEEETEAVPPPPHYHHHQQNHHHHDLLLNGKTVHGDDGGVVVDGFKVDMDIRHHHHHLTHMHHHYQQQQQHLKTGNTRDKVNSLGICLNCGRHGHNLFQCRWERISDDELQKKLRDAKQKLQRQELDKQELKCKADKHPLRFRDQ
ncbi:hypothetical protein niasHS_016689 [Heterodera schachtii]|uniref:CCHC-type domain-containing protein n=1 Tax=Heterodera schachtii TaxID=97005 RepID=A0ABD2I0T7_HETSC